MSLEIFISMSRTRKYVSIFLWSTLVIAMLAVLTTWAGFHLSGGDARDESLSADPILPVFGDVPAFALTDQDNRPFGTDQLRGRAWISSFIFTRCPGPCPRMTQTMRQLQKDLDDPGIQLISFSVDPDFDQPEVLADYARDFGADQRSWRFLTGEKVAIYRVARAFKLTAVDATPDAPIIHSTRFTLIDADGRVRGYYDSLDRDQMRQLRTDAATLGRETMP